MGWIHRGLLVLTLALIGAGCGTTKYTDTTRTATEQLLISSAMDDVVDEFNFYPLSGRKIFIKSDGVCATDKEYLLSILRQQLAANGVLIQEDKEKADYILEISTGAVGTDRFELVFGTKETSVPSALTMGVATTIPEFALAKRTDQKAKVKLTMWAYNKTTGAIIWQSGQKNKTTSIRDRWFFGIGPITKSSFNEKTQIGGDDVPFDIESGERIAKNEKPSVRTEAIYRELDHEAIDRLEKLRKDGLESMSFDLSEEETQYSNGEGESKKDADSPKEAKTGETVTAKTDEVKKDETNGEKTKDAVSSAEGTGPAPTGQEAPVADSTTPPPTTPDSTTGTEKAVSETVDVVPVPAQGIGATNSSASAPTPTLEFDDWALTYGETIVAPEERK